MAISSRNLDRPADWRETRPWLNHYEPGVPHTISYPPVPVGALLERAAADYPTQPAAIFDGVKISYRELDNLANRLANALQRLGVNQGDRVAIMLPNCPQFIVTYYGIAKIGAIAVPLNPQFVAREVEYHLNDSGAETIVALTESYPLLQSIRDHTTLRDIITTDLHDCLPPPKDSSGLMTEQYNRPSGPIDRSGAGYLWSDLLATQPTTIPPVTIHPDDIAVLLYTGGTTGIPKGAMLTHSNLVANASQIVAWIPWLRKAAGSVLGVLPFFHSYGMSHVMNFAIASGLTLILLPRFDVYDVLEALREYQPTYFDGVPTMYTALNNSPHVKQYDIRSVRACISGGAPLPGEVAQTFEILTGGRLVEGYGLTEASPVTHCTPVTGQRKSGSIGLPLPDTEARVVDLATGETELPPGEIGELVIRGPQVMRGYWHRPAETAQVLQDGWLYTGDIAKRDEDGYFYIVDRKKDVIITSGFNVYPSEVEEVLYQYPKIAEAAVAGVPDQYRGETVKAYVVLKKGEIATEPEIVEYCRANLARYKAPRIVAFRQTLPKTGAGKVSRRALVEEDAGQTNVSS